MKNKEGSHNRPCFYAFSDVYNPDIMWCIPISSQVQKFEGIVQHKLEGQAAKGIKSPKCDTIRFGSVMGQKRAFLIQNMFPVTDQYVTNIYIDRNTQNPVTIPPEDERSIRKSAKDVLKLVFHGHSNLVFSDIMKTYSDLKSELQEQRDMMAAELEEEPEL